MASGGWSGGSSGWSGTSAGWSGGSSGWSGTSAGWSGGSSGWSGTSAGWSGGSSGWSGETASQPSGSTSAENPQDSSSDIEDDSYLGVEPQQNIARIPLPTPRLVNGLLFAEAVVGTSQPDNIIGAEIGELISGGYAKDRLIGNGGSDCFLFDAQGQFGKSLADIVVDFNRMENDKLLISQDVFSGIGAVSITRVRGGNQAKEAATSNKDFIFNSSSGFLYYNENGKMKGFGEGGVFSILKDVPSLGKSDIQIV